MELKELLRQEALRAGFCSFGVALATEVDPQWTATYSQWIAAGENGGMEYLSNHADLRRDPRLLLPGARSVISLVLSYFHTESGTGDARFAMYAHGDDYHEVARSRMLPLVELLENQGYKTRMCVDTAPMRERYWALRSGVAFAGRNGLAIVPGHGSYCFLCEIITTAELTPDSPLGYGCDGCGRCLEVCPGKAIREGGMVDARRCHSYLSIEHRGEFPEGTALNILYGCDECQRVCPHNKDIPVTAIQELRQRESLGGLTLADVEAMTQEQFSAIFRHSAVKRCKLTGLQRNLRYLRKP